MSGDPMFSGRPFGAFLFDMDGTILNSVAAAERVWTIWAQRHQLDVAAFLPTIHGVKAIETIRGLDLPGIDLQSEVDALLLAEMDDVDGIEAIAGAASFLASLPSDRWAIVTSAPRELAKRRLEAAGIPFPPLMVAGEDVANGKPAPDCFLLAARQLGCLPGECLVFEDAIAGIRAAEAADMSVLVVSTTHRHPLEHSHPSVDGYERLSFRTDTDGTMTILQTQSRT